MKTKNNTNAFLLRVQVRNMATLKDSKYAVGLAVWIKENNIGKST